MQCLQSQCHASQAQLLTEDEERRGHTVRRAHTQPQASQSLSPVQIVPSARTMKTFFFLVKSSDTTKSMTGTGDTFWEIYGLAPQNMGDAIIPK